MTRTGHGWCREPALRHRWHENDDGRPPERDRPSSSRAGEHGAGWESPVPPGGLDQRRFTFSTAEWDVTDPALFFTTTR